METPIEKLGKNIKRIREQLQMSQSDICKTADIDTARLSEIETGKGNPTLATIDKIAKVLGVSNDELLK